MKRTAIAVFISALLLINVLELLGDQFSVRTRKAWADAAEQGELNSGDIVIRLTGACGTGFTEVTDLAGVFPLGTTNGAGNQGTSGGNDNITPAGTNSAPSLTMNAYTPVGTNTSGAVSAHSGTAVADHASHTHTYTEVPNHVHLVEGFPTATGGSTGFTRDTSMSGTPANTNQNTATNTGGVATGTTAGPSATLTHSVTQPSNHTFTQPTFTGTEATLTGTVAAPTFTGTQFDNRPAFKRVIFCAKQ